MRLLIVSFDEPLIAKAVAIAAKVGSKARTVPSLAAAMAELRSGRGADQLWLPAEADVAGFVRRLRGERIHVPVVAYGVQTDARAAVQAIRGGAIEFLPLPPDEDLIAAVVEANAGPDGGMVGSDPAMQATLALARRVAPSDASVLIDGESGVGKEVLARFVHDQSKRAGGPFVSLNCAAIPENLLESELFGHEKGAFTGAATRRIGKFEEANGGTLLLDEISEMDPRLQAKLLRALQEREIDRVGGTKPVPIDIRVLATTNRDLEAAVKAGTFREDLMFRLNVLTLTVPPLRARQGDIEPLATFFLAKFAKLNGLPRPKLSVAAVRKMQAYGWPGNVRELENCMHRALLMADGALLDGDAILLPELSTTAPVRTGDGGLVGRTVADVERELILSTLDHTRGNRTHAATVLGISIRTLRNRLSEYTANGASLPLAAGERG
ncbi:MAG: sigma-54-dependent Fis family transcriptional regulator [Geminicoccaceae bacterium]|nr:MAG: sigma-54-dependent Fis family transcriptional regulator [Geminicoccaceae bacterium]